MSNMNTGSETYLPEIFISEMLTSGQVDILHLDIFQLEVRDEHHDRPAWRTLVHVVQRQNHIVGSFWRCVLFQN